MQTSQGVESFLTFLREAEQQHSMAQAEADETEQQTQDILHAVEFGSYNARRTARLTQKLREVRQRRRKAKNALEFTEYIATWAAENRTVIKSLERLLGDLRRLERRNQCRMYTPRTDVMNDLEAGDSK